MNVTIADRVKLAVTLVCTAILVFVLWISRDHITQTAYRIGLRGYQAETLFILIDIVALVGKVLSTKYFARSTRVIGFRLMVVSGSLSLACNVFAGHNLGERLYGVFVVALFVGLEQVVVRIKPAGSVSAARTRAAKTAPTAAPAATTGRKHPAGCACGVHNRTRKPRIPVSAPVSPGPMGPGPVGPSVAQLDELVGAAAYI